MDLFAVGRRHGSVCCWKQIWICLLLEADMDLFVVGSRPGSLCCWKQIWISLLLEADMDLFVVDLFDVGNRHGYLCF